MDTFAKDPVGRTIIGNLNSIRGCLTELRAQVSRLDSICMTLGIPSFPPTSPKTPSEIVPIPDNIPRKLEDIEGLLVEQTNLLEYRVGAILARLGDMSHTPEVGAALGQPSIRN